MARAECGTTFDEGDLMFNYYDMKPVVVGKGDDWNGVVWFQCRNYDKETAEPLGSTLLDGSRMCSLEAAVRYGHATQEQVDRFRTTMAETETA